VSSFLTLPAVAAVQLLPSAEQQSIDISCSPGTQQQTQPLNRSSGLRRANGTMGVRTLGQIGSADPLEKWMKN